MSQSQAHCAAAAALKMCLLSDLNARNYREVPIMRRRRRKPWGFPDVRAISSALSEVELQGIEPVEHALVASP